MPFLNLLGCTSISEMWRGLYRRSMVDRKRPRGSWSSPSIAIIMSASCGASCCGCASTKDRRTSALAHCVISLRYRIWSLSGHSGHGRTCYRRTRSRMTGRGKPSAVTGVQVKNQRPVFRFNRDAGGYGSRRSPGRPVPSDQMLIAVSGKTGWKNYLLPKSSRRPVLKRQLSAVAFNNLLGNREAKASAGSRLAPRRINPEKGLEYA